MSTVKAIRKITLDVNRINETVINVKQGDENSRYLNVKVTNVGNVLPIPPGTFVRLTTRDSVSEYADSSGEVESDGTVTVLFTPAMLKNPGRGNADIEFTGSGGERLSSLSFIYSVEAKAVPDSATMADSNFSALVDALAQVAGFEAVKNEVQTARGTYNSVDARLDSIESDVSENATDINAIATRMNDAEEDIGMLDEGLTGALNRITESEDDIAAIAGRVETTETNIGALQSRATTAENNIVTAQTDINELKQQTALTDIELNTIVNAIQQVGSSYLSVNGYGTLSLPKNAAQGAMQTELDGNTLTNETTYNRDTWAEWAKSAGVVGDSTGLEITTANGAYRTAAFTTKLKPSTKYGYLINIVSNNIDTNGVFIDSFNNPQTNFLMLNGTGNIKFIDTTKASWINNRILIATKNTLADGLKIKIKDFRVFELPAGSAIETHFNTLTADQLAALYPYIDGTKSAIIAREVTVSKNLFDKSKVAIGRYVNWVTGNLDNNTIYNATDFIQLLPTLRTYKSSSAFTHHAWYDKNKTFISGVSTATTDFTAPSNAEYIRGSLGAAVNLDTFQFEAGTIATPYMAYVPPTYSYNEPSKYNRVPSGVCDVRDKQGNKRVRVRQHIIQESDITSTTNGTNIQRVVIPLSKFEGIIAQTDVVNNSTLVEGYIRETSAANIDAAGFENYWCTNTTSFVLLKPKNSYADVNAARAALAGTVIYYQLAADKEQIIANVSSGSLISYPSGTYYMDYAVTDAGVYTDKATISRTAYPIKEIESLYKYNKDGTLTQLTASSAVIAADKLSFTHPTLANKDVWFGVLKFDVAAPLGQSKLSPINNELVKQDTVNGKWYKLGVSYTNGVPALTGIEV